MIRKDRQVTDPKEMRTFLDACNVVRVAMCDGEFPYIVPLSFGWDWEGEFPRIYVHSAPRGHKVELLKANPHVCVEFDRFIRYDQLKHGITARYQSLIGRGIAYELNEPEEKSEALRRLCEHCGYKLFDPADCGSLAHTKAWRIDISELSAKQNLRKLS